MTESAADTGSTPSGPTGHAAATWPVAADRGHHLLVVDDDEMQVELLRALLHAAGYDDVTSTTSPATVIGLLNARPVDVLVMDLLMPEVSGLTILEQLKAGACPAPGPRVVAITGDTDVHTKRRALALGAADFLTKPFDGPEVVLRIGNILENIRLQRELAARADHLRRANDDLSRFAFAAVHDLAHPLAVIGANLHILETQVGGGAPASSPALGRLNQGVQSMREILDAFLDYCRSGAEAERVDVAAGECLTAALDNLRPKLDALGAAIDAGPLPTVRVARTRMTQIFQNLLANAVTYVADGVQPRVTVRASRLSAAWLFEVVDNGIGISEGDRHRVFGLLERLDPGRTLAAGSGIGLAVCKHVVEGWGGEITVDAAPTGGSRFAFTVPDWVG